MRLILTALCLATTIALGYIAAPFWTAWTLREAIRTGDKAHLERKIEWDSVRTTLKASLARHAQLVPELSESAAPIKPGLWQRVKIAFGQSMIDSFVERYVTADGLPRLFEVRQTINSKVRREPDEQEGLSSRERFRRFWSRLKRAEFMSLTQVEIEIEDRRNPERRYVSQLELKNFEWKLTGLAILAASPTKQPVAEIDASVTPAGSIRLR